MEAALFDGGLEAATGGDAPLLDGAALATYFLVTELSKNPDGYRGSAFMHKARPPPLLPARRSCACTTPYSTYTMRPQLICARRFRALALHSVAPVIRNCGPARSSAPSTARHVQDASGPLRMGPPWDYNEAYGLCCGYPIEGFLDEGRSGPGVAGGSAISPEGWRFNICEDAERCVVEPGDGLSQWYRRLWQVRPRGHRRYRRCWGHAAWLVATLVPV